MTPSKVLEPSLLAPSEYYDTPTSERGGPQKKRQVSLQRSVDSESLESVSKRPGLERRTSDITSDISLDNLLEGSRRKRNKFSSDLPLLPLPTPTSVVSSHQGGHVGSRSQARGRADSASTTRTVQHTPGRVSIPTPAPTTISDEDVAIQLIRLGDPSLSPFKAPPSNESSSPIPSLTTAMQLKALHDGPELQHDAQPSKREMDYPSSPPASVSDSQDHKDSMQDARDHHHHHHRDTSRVSDYGAHSRPSLGESDYNLKDETDVEDDIEIDIPRPQNLPHFHDSMQCKSNDHGASLTAPSSAGADPATESRQGAGGNGGGPSVGVRCTRCKKSKKGCDRQRPCGRCADANEDCVTEDESSGRRGRNNRGGRRTKR